MIVSLRFGGTARGAGSRLAGRGGRGTSGSARQGPMPLVRNTKVRVTEVESTILFIEVAWLILKNAIQRMRPCPRSAFEPEPD